MDKGFINDIDPVMFSIGSFELRWYFFFFYLNIIIGLCLWTWQMRRGGYPFKVVWPAFPFGVLFYFLGMRFVHHLFYEGGHGLSIFIFWRGGYASHGAVFGIALFMVLWAKIGRISFVDICDRFMFSGALGSALIRMGNFMESEIVGRQTDLPWGVRFMDYDKGRILRHPSQLYEFALGMAVLFLVIWTDKKFGKEKRPLGLLTGLMLSVYSIGRFFVEYVKEYQFLDSESVFTMGQYLSMATFMLGVGFLIFAFKTKRRAGYQGGDK